MFQLFEVSYRDLAALLASVFSIFSAADLRFAIARSKSLVESVLVNRVAVALDLAISIRVLLLHKKLSKKLIFILMNKIFSDFSDFTVADP